MKKMNYVSFMTHIERIEAKHLITTLQKRNKVKEGQDGNDQEMAQSERNSHSTNRGVGKHYMTLGYLYQENIS